MSTTSSELEQPEYVKLQTNDGVIFTVDTRLALQMGPIRKLIILERENNITKSEAFPLARVDAKNLQFIIKWSASVEDLKDTVMDRLSILKKQLVEDDADYEFLLQLILAVNYLQMEDLLQATTQLLAHAIEGCQSVEEIRNYFNVQAD
ncbi:SKP1-like protein 16 [Drosophila subpulchrella]|uniref:SKP1-like protein 16 n=1 Tax=Drosophila subpulchrella TaxID=1486046 RepID=UPI0018A16ED1|nr:SKP1-like protein 16 [Drosophila subpulchrella]